MYSLFSLSPVVLLGTSIDADGEAYNKYLGEWANTNGCSYEIINVKKLEDNDGMKLSFTLFIMHRPNFILIEVEKAKIAKIIEDLAVRSLSDAGVVKKEEKDVTTPTGTKDEPKKASPSIFARFASFFRSTPAVTA